MQTNRRLQNTCRGSILVLVIVMTATSALVVGSILRYCVTEARVNAADLLTNEARLSAEAVLNHGMAQLRRRYDRTRQISPLELQPDRITALRLEPGFLALAQETRMTIPNTYVAPTSVSQFQSSPTMLGAVMVNNGDPVNISIDSSLPLPQDGLPGVPTNSDIREVRVYAKATVSSSLWGDRTAYVRQTFQVLDRSLFQNTVFYNGLLEIFPGANMNLGGGSGPIYGADVRIGNNVRIHTRLETSGEFRVGRYHNNDNRNDNAFLTNFNVFSGETPANLNSVSYLLGLKAANTGSSAPLQTGVDGFAAKALTAYAGGLLTADHGVAAQSAVGLEFLRELSIQEQAASGTTYNNAAGEFDQGLYDRMGSNYGHLLVEPSRGKLDIDPATMTEAQVREAEALNSVEENRWSVRSALSIELDPATDTVKFFRQPVTSGVPDYFGNTRSRTELVVNDVFPDPASRFWTVERFRQDGGVDSTVQAGLYDYRQAAGNNNNAAGRINLLRLDMGKMREWVEENYTGTGTAPTFDDDWWNGTVYVKLPEQSNPGRDDEVVPAVANWGVQVHNAVTLPNRRVVDVDAPKGVTLATNGALYVQGTYNAPDRLTWDESTYGVSPGAEVPAALIGDAIMLLSDNWTNARSGLDGTSDRLALDTVYSAALVTGNVPSNTLTTKYSGGIENFPRLLENWSSRTLTYRGSLIRLFRSESFTSRWGYGDVVYKAANRNWSFHTGYLTDPPNGDLGPRKFRRHYFQELTRAEFNAQTSIIFGSAP